MHLLIDKESKITEEGIEWAIPPKRYENQEGGNDFFLGRGGLRRNRLGLGTGDRRIG